MTVTDLRPLPVWGRQLPGDYEALKAAKVALDLPFSIVPAPAVPGSPTRVLAMREVPPFIADYALVRDPSNPAAMLAAMGWALDDTIEDPRATLVFQQLQGVFGPDLKEVPYVEDPDALPALHPRRFDPND